MLKFQIFQKTIQRIQDARKEEPEYETFSITFEHDKFYDMVLVLVMTLPRKDLFLMILLTDRSVSCQLSKSFGSDVMACSSSIFKSTLQKIAAWSPLSQKRSLYHAFPY